MSTYHINTHDSETTTQLTQESLKGVFAYLNLVNEPMHLEIILVENNSKTPIYASWWDGVSFPSESPTELLSEEQPLGLSIKHLRLSGRYDSDKISSLYHLVDTSNLDEFKHGFNLMHSIDRESNGYYTFGLFDSNRRGCTLLSSLSGFPLLELPNEVLDMITSYYPRDWHLVSKQLCQFVQDKTILDPRYTDVQSMEEITTRVCDLLSNPSTPKEVVQSCARYAYFRGAYSIRGGFAKKVLCTTVHMEVVDAILDAPSNGYLGVSDTILDIINEIDNGNIVRYLINNKRYSDILYFDVTEENIRDANSISILLEHDFAVIDPMIISRSSTFMIIEYTRAIIRRGGKVKKGPTNPKTGTTREGYSRGSDINVSDHLFSLPWDMTDMTELVLNNIDLLEDDDRISLLLGFAFEIGKTNDLELLEKIYRKIFTSRYIGSSEKTNYLWELVQIHAPKYGYNEEFLNRIRSIEWSTCM